MEFQSASTDWMGFRTFLLRADIKNWYDRDKTNGQTDATFENYMKLWKANARGVDLNRNFNYGFAEYSGAKIRAQ